jgi:Bifunctional DNA primase/polymerase, N-terminal
MTNPLLDTARQLVSAGVSVIPIKADGSKAPASTLLPIDAVTMTPSWKPYQTRIANDKELVHWFSKPHVGIAIIAGAVSGNIEILDFDDPSTLRPWFELVEDAAPGLIARLVLVKTPTGGEHVYYRCATIQGNQKLAVNAQREVMIETRGEGGYALIPPSPAKCHKLNRPYVVSQGDLAHIPTITEDERDILLKCARALTQYVEPERVYTPRQNLTSSGERPGDLYAAKVSWEAILLPHGWLVVGHRGEVTLWCRPGKTDGISATTGHCGDHLYVFSSNAHPFEPERAYGKFAAFAFLNAAGDFIRAATMLACQGFVNAHERQLANGYKGYQGYRGYHGYRGMKGVVSHGED